MQETAALLGVRVPELWELDFVELLNGARDVMEEFANMQGMSPPYVVRGVVLNPSQTFYHPWTTPAFRARKSCIHLLMITPTTRGHTRLQ